MPHIAGVYMCIVAVASRPFLPKASLLFSRAMFELFSHLLSSVQISIRSPSICISCAFTLLAFRFAVQEYFSKVNIIAIIIIYFRYYMEFWCLKQTRSQVLCLICSSTNKRRPTTPYRPQCIWPTSEQSSIFACYHVQFITFTIMKNFRHVFSCISF